MAVIFVCVTDPGRTLKGAIQQITPGGTPGLIWNRNTGTWESSVSTADRAITLTEGGLADLGQYTGGVSGNLATYTGYVLKSIHDSNLSEQTIGISIAYLVNGDEARDANYGDLAGIAAQVRAELLANPVPASNMRGTDNALLAASYTAPNNAGITSAAADSASVLSTLTGLSGTISAGSTAAQNVDTRLTNARATKLDNLDALISSRSTLTAAEVRTELNSNPVPASNMRGTDNALLAASYTAPLNSDITAAKTAALAAQTAAENVDSRLTATRAGYLDNLSGGAVALQSTVSSITNSTRIKIQSAHDFVIPTSGTTTYVIDLLLYDTAGNMEAPDSTPTFTAANQLGNDRSVNLGSVTTIGTGYYRVTYAVSSAHLTEQIILKANVVEGGQTLVDSRIIAVNPEVAGGPGGSGDFTSSDRTKLEAIFNKLPTKLYLTGTAASDGDINLDECDGSRTPFKADVSALATTSQVNTIPQTTHDLLESDPVPMLGYVAPDNTGIANALTQATTAATQSTTAASQATQANSNAFSAALEAVNAKLAAQSVDTKLTSARALKLDNLDAAISTRSTFDHTTNTVTLTSGQDIATNTNALAIKAKTDNLPSQPAAVSSIPTAAQVAVQVDATLSASHPGNWAGGGDATAAKQDQILAALSGIVPSPPSAVQVSLQRTWRLTSDGENSLAPNVVVLPAGTTATLAMDFAALLNPGTGISTVASVVDLSVNALTPSEIAPSQDRLKAHFKVTGIVSGKIYQFKVTVSTTDGQTLTGRGNLRCD